MSKTNWIAEAQNLASVSPVCAQIDSASLYALVQGEPSAYWVRVTNSSRNLQAPQDLADGRISSKLILSSFYCGSKLFSSFGKREFTQLTYKVADEDVKETTRLFANAISGQRGTWTTFNLEDEKLSALLAGLEVLVSRIIDFTSLEVGWDSYDGKKIEWSTISRAISFLAEALIASNGIMPIPFVAPLSDGGIKFEWRTWFKELIYIFPETESGPFSFLKTDILEGVKNEGVASSVSELIELLDSWLLQNTYVGSRIY